MNRPGLDFACCPIWWTGMSYASKTSWQMTSGLAPVI
jgi:hypothetical protein